MEHTHDRDDCDVCGTEATGFSVTLTKGVHRETGEEAWAAVFTLYDVDGKPMAWYPMGQCTVGKAIEALQMVQPQVSMKDEEGVSSGLLADGMTMQ